MEAYLHAHAWKLTIPGQLAYKEGAEGAPTPSAPRNGASSSDYGNHISQPGGNRSPAGLTYLIHCRIISAAKTSAAKLASTFSRNCSMSSTSFYWKLAHARNLLHLRREIKARKRVMNFCEGSEQN